MIRMLSEIDAPAWHLLWHAYLASDGSTLSPTITDATWLRLVDPTHPIRCALAFSGSDPVGLAHYIFHPSTWALRETCYLEDLFVITEARRRGHARALIGFVCSEARARGAAEVHWRTNADNHQAIGLYEQVAGRVPVVTYSVPLAGPIKPMIHPDSAVEL